MKSERSFELICEVSGKNEEALRILGDIRHVSPGCAIDIAQTLNDYGVTGDKIERMYSFCCGKDIQVFIKTVWAFGQGKYLQSEIDEKLEQGESFEV